ncbi:MAG TPA: TAT-variant-translocated molybdopterin oxidoreductase [Candidatus Binatia bacterium]|nr:TAT-variant-translocated molybdopterin oxidoreductase [Candidatus Binatia bacterium]
MNQPSIDLTAIRQRLAHRRGRQYWRSLEELAESEEFRAFLDHEFPRQAAPLHDGVDRRQFLQLMGASLALAGLSACTRQPTEYVVPYVKPPTDVTPGEPLFFATALPHGGIGTGVLVESHMGRPTKVEGNPDHPASLGATDAFAQAAVLTLYDPDRSQVITSAGEIRPWGAFLDALKRALEAQRERGGAGIRLLTETVTSPTLAAQIRSLLAAFPQAKWHQWEPVNHDTARAGARLAFGEPVDAVYRFDQADVILSLDADFLACGPGHLRYVREFTRKRRVQGEHAAMNRLYVVEPTPSTTGAKADHRLPLRAGEIDDFARAIAAGLGVSVQPPASLGRHAQWLAAVVRDLQAHRGTSLVLAGAHLSPTAHALVHAINHALGNVGKTLVYTEPVEAEPIDQAESLRTLVTDMAAGAVNLLVILGANPAYNAAADVPFAESLAKVGMRVHVGLYDDETAQLCHWHIPEAHALESWSDIRAFDGTATIVQPLIAPLYEGSKSFHEILAAFSDRPDRSGYDLVRDHWKSVHGDADFERVWRKALHDGVIPNTAAAPKSVTLNTDWLSAVAKLPAPDARLEIVFRPDPTIGDGRFANNGWLQELAKPITKLVWDNAALICPATAERLGLANEDVIELRYNGRAVRAPIWITPGQAADSVTVHLGYGRSRSGNLGTGIGFNGYSIRTAASPWLGAGAEIGKTGERYALASTQHHHSMEGRHLVRSASLAEYRRHPEFARELEEAPPPDMSMYPPHHYDGYAWGMAIDLNACIGCNACVIACQSENNIPVVGKDQVARGREMHWIRVDRYFEGDLDNPRTHHQPVPCMHCEDAPCEVVCPVNATVHSAEGLNEMVYNRCVGTKYCSNNCPYKVRRFNFYLYTNQQVESLKLLANPDVTVRTRGVMEKCSYCVQRIDYARIRAKREDRTVRDGEIVTACQQVCPAEAIVFGDINNADSRVAQLKAEPRNYGLLSSLGTRPRTSYLASVRNPNPDLSESEGTA